MAEAARLSVVLDNAVLAGRAAFFRCGAGRRGQEPWTGRIERRQGMNNGSSGELNLGHLFQAVGLNCEDVMVIRHSLNTGGLASRAEAMGPRLLAYTRVQRTGNKVRKSPPKIWLNFLVTSGYRARFLTTFENHGEIREKSLDQDRYFDLRPSEVLSALQHRLVIEWTADPVNWAIRRVRGGTACGGDC